MTTQKSNGKDDSWRQHTRREHLNPRYLSVLFALTGTLTGSSFHVLSEWKIYMPYFNKPERMFKILSLYI